MASEGQHSQRPVEAGGGGDASLDSTWNGYIYVSHIPVVRIGRREASQVGDATDLGIDTRSHLQEKCWHCRVGEFAGLPETRHQSYWQN